MLDLNELRKVAQVIYIVADEAIADDISFKLLSAVKEIEYLRNLLCLTSKSYDYTKQKLYITERNRLLSKITKNDGLDLTYNFRYDDDYNNSTLRINFKNPFGIGSFGFGFINDEPLKHYIGEDDNFDLYKKCQRLENQINETIINGLKIFKITISDLDWRDEFELEIDSIDQNKFTDNIMSDLDSKLKELLK
jgi:hypothetical protein